jgi:hypothetical protein
MPQLQQIAFKKLVRYQLLCWRLGFRDKIYPSRQPPGAFDDSDIELPLSSAPPLLYQWIDRSPHFINRPLNGEMADHSRAEGRIHAARRRQTYHHTYRAATGRQMQAIDRLSERTDCAAFVQHALRRVSDESHHAPVKVFIR